MPRPFEVYKQLIDALVSVREGVEARRAIDGVWPPREGNEEINELLASLPIEQRRVLAAMLQKAREGGIHDTLAFLDDEISLRGLKLFRDGEEIAIPDFSGEMHYDWVCRCQGDEWPDER